MITFADLKVLHQLYPDKFRELTLTGWDQDTKETVYFDAKNHADMPIALAARISMAIPVVFTPVVYKGDRMADGGIGSNAPSEVATRRDPSDPDTELTGAEREKAMMTTAVLTFDEGADAQAKSGKPGLAGAYDVLHGPPKEPGIFELAFGDLVGSITGAIAGNPDYSATNQQDRAKIAAAGPNALVVGHGTTGTGSFFASPETLRAAQQHATDMMLAQIKLRENMAYSKKFVSAGQAARAMFESDLDPTKKAKILADGQPKRESYKTDVEFEIASTLYNMTKAEAERASSGKPN
jgi:hypothetical protein